jgi:glucose-1-phosphate adenylyltransferase
MNDTLAIILGGGAGVPALSADRNTVEASRAHRREIPAHRCADQRMPARAISAHLRADAVQFRSLNRHISNTYRLDRFSGGFVEILAAEQTPDNPNWYQGTADAVGRRPGTSRSTRRSTT